MSSSLKLLLIGNYLLSRKEFQNLPQKERQRVLTAVKKRFKSSTEGPPPAKKRKKESGDYDTPDAGGDNKSNKDADGKPVWINVDFTNMYRN